MSHDGLAQARAKMADGGVDERAIGVFAHYYEELEAGATGMIRERDVEPLRDVPRLADVEVDEDEVRAALARTAILKLNGGLGTSMGMDRAKSLLEVRDGHTFLDIIVGQVGHVRQRYDVRLPLVVMNSFRTRDDTLAALARHQGIAVDGVPLDFLQNREPKLRADDLTPVEWPDDPDLEWCPPGHGDLYTALEVSGMLRTLLDQGYRYAGVSNSDNLGAEPDPTVAAWFARSGAPYAAEVCQRTPADVKGGYLVVRRSDGRMVLRETAQTPDEDQAAAADLDRHGYFHTNNLWFDLQAVADALQARDGVLGLPLIRNLKTVDPSDGSSPKVIQVETAMGAAVEVFDGAQAIEVDRSRFLPVKTTDDLLLLRSDFYDIGDDWLLRAHDSDTPLVHLDKAYYKLVADFESRFPVGAPSLTRATALTVEGDWTFGRDVAVVGDVTLPDRGEPARVEDDAVIGRTE